MSTYSILPGRPEIAGNPILAQEERLKRKRALLTEQQRRVAEGIGALPEGQMVSGHYVAPNITELLHKGIADPYFKRKQAEATEKQLGEEEGALRTQIEAAAEQAMQAGRDKEVPFEAPGIDEADAAAAGKGAKRVQKGDRVAMARQLGQLPGYQQLGQQVLADELLNAPIRAEATAERKQARADAQQAKADELAARMEDSRLSREQRDAAARELRELQREIAAQASADRRFAASEAAGSRRDAAAIAAAGRPKPEDRPLPPKIIDDLSGMEERAGTFKRLSGSFDAVAPDASGIRGAIASRVGAYKPGGSKAADWWADYRRNSELAERNALFGASLTEGEKTAWQQASISPGMDADVIRRNLKTQEDIYRKAYNRQRARYQKSGYNVERAFEPAAAGPGNQQRTTAPGTVPQGWKVERE